MMWDNDWSGGEWLAMSLMMVAFWGLVVVGVVALVRWTRSDQPAPPPSSQPVGPDPLRVLDERFARGEIDAAEYTERRDLLKHG